jgi:hypothetical protein
MKRGDGERCDTGFQLHGYGDDRGARFRRFFVAIAASLR